MKNVELWIGKNGTGKTEAAIKLLQSEISENGFFSLRYIVPTVDTKREVENRYFKTSDIKTLLNDPINIFFAFAKEIAGKNIQTEKYIDDITRKMLLKEVVQKTPLEYFERASKFDGFIDELSNIIDELKIHMIDEELVKKASLSVKDLDENYSKKLAELGDLYANYQSIMKDNNCYDREGLMWIAAAALQDDNIDRELKTVVFDGFGRLTPIQLHFISVLAKKMQRVILIFDADKNFPDKYSPEMHSIEMLTYQLQNIGILPKIRPFEQEIKTKNNLSFLKDNLFCANEKKDQTYDGSVTVTEAINLITEAEQTAIDIKKLLKDGKYSPADIAVIQKNSGELQNIYHDIFKRHNLPLGINKTPLISTKVGRTISLIISILQNNWQREDLLSLLKCGVISVQKDKVYFLENKALRLNFSMLDPKSLATILNDRRDKELTADDILPPLQPLINILDAVNSKNFCNSFREILTDIVKPNAENSFDLKCCETVDKILTEIDLSEFGITEESLNERLKVLRNTCAEFEVEQSNNTIFEEINFLNSSSLGGQRFKCVFIVNMQHGIIPGFVKESPFLMDHERNENIKKMTGLSIEMRKNYEIDEMSLFARMINSAEEKIFLSYYISDINGSRQEISDYLREIAAVLPTIFDNRRIITADHALTDIFYSSGIVDYIERLILKTHNKYPEEVDFAAVAAISKDLRSYYDYLTFTRNRTNEITVPIFKEVHENADYSATNLQAYLDCKYKWFFEKELRAELKTSGYSHLDRGTIIHKVLEQTFNYIKSKENVTYINLSLYDLEEIKDYALHLLSEELKKHPAPRGEEEYFYKTEEAELMAQIDNLLSAEYSRSKTRKMHPAKFEYSFKNVTVKNIRLKGTIDRIDIADGDCDKIAIADYKTGKIPNKNDIIKIRQLQGTIYALALKKEQQKEVIGTYFLNPRQKMSGVIKEDAKELLDDNSFTYLKEEEWDKMMEEASSVLEELYINICNGLIEYNENNSCRYCDYSHICQKSN